MSLADAQSLAIRKLLTKAAFDSTITPGPPLPKSHPSPALIAKLHLECASLYSSARALAKTPASSHHKSKLSFSKGKERDSDDFGSGEVSPVLRHYLSSEAAFHSILAHKWLGVDAGERSQAGESVGFLSWAKQELADLKDTNGKSLSVNASDREKEMREWRKARLAQETECVAAFLKGYQKMNDSVVFQEVPGQADLQARIPAGRLAVARKEWTKPVPAFGPGSVEDARRKAEALEVEDQSGVGSEKLTPDAASPRSVGAYAGSGSYF